MRRAAVSLRRASLARRRRSASWKRSSRDSSWRRVAWACDWYSIRRPIASAVDQTLRVASAPAASADGDDPGLGRLGGGLGAVGDRERLRARPALGLGKPLRRLVQLVARLRDEPLDVGAQFLTGARERLARAGVRRLAGELLRAGADLTLGGLLRPLGL